MEMSYITSNECSLSNDKQLQILIENMKVVLTGRDDSKPNSKDSIKELALEIGTNTDILYGKILEIFS